MAELTVKTIRKRLVKYMERTEDCPHRYGNKGKNVCKKLDFEPCDLLECPEI